jgi:hypothetical protein
MASLVDRAAWRADPSPIDLAEPRQRGQANVPERRIEGRRARTAVAQLAHIEHFQRCQLSEKPEVDRVHFTPHREALQAVEARPWDCRHHLTQQWRCRALREQSSVDGTSVSENECALRRNSSSTGQRSVTNTIGASTHHQPTSVPGIGSRWRTQARYSTPARGSGGECPAVAAARSLPRPYNDQRSQSATLGA